MYIYIYTYIYIEILLFNKTNDIGKVLNMEIFISYILNLNIGIPTYVNIIYLYILF